LSAKSCDECGHEFTASVERLKACADCGSLNPAAVTECVTCGRAFSPDFSLTLDEALRTGAIVRGMDLDETQVAEGERIAPAVRHKLLSSGDETLIRIVKVLPEESWARLQAILAEAGKK